MKRSALALLVTLPWLAAVLLLLVARVAANTRELRLALMGSAAICFSIGCLARTSAGLQPDATDADHMAALPPPSTTDQDR
ncbi:MAG: hypothetical protein ACKN89_16675 [Cyanobium sp.]